jgi:hypothetical protein
MPDGYSSPGNGAFYSHAGHPAIVSDTFRPGIKYLLKNKPLPESAGIPQTTLIFDPATAFTPLGGCLNYPFVT